MLNSIHVHLMLNHIPVLGMVFTSLLLAYALIRDQAELRKAALTLFILLALVTPAVYLSGEGAEEGVEHLAGVSESAIEEHEEAGLPALIAVEGVGAAALVLSLLWFFPAASRWRGKAGWTLLLLSLFASTVLVRTAYTGGKIRHGQELNNTGTAPPAQREAEGED